MPFLPEQSVLKQEAYHRLVSAYWEAKKFMETVRVIDQLLEEFPATEYRKTLQLSRAMGLMYADRRDEGVAALEAALDDEGVRATGETYSTALQTLHWYYMNEDRYISGSREFQERKRDPDYMRGIVERTKASAERAIELYELIVQDLEGTKDRRLRAWLVNWGARGTRACFLNERGAYELLLPAEERERLLLRFVDKFSSEPRALYVAHLELSELSAYLGHWQQTVESYRYLLEHPELHSTYESVPYSKDSWHYAPSAAIDQDVENRSKLASIAYKQLDQPDVAVDAFQRLISDFGVAHHRGVDTVKALDELDAPFEFPEKAALVWGGGRDVRNAWRNVLAPLGYTVHSVQQYQISAAHLAPYQIVVLARTGNLPYEPTDVLALRSYAATGGSLLVIVSPGWEPAASGIHNPLLELFDAKAGQEMTVRATSTRIVPHPITQGIEQAMAKNAVHLTVPPEATLIEAADRTVLAAMPYRHGRVVIASFGQWFQPGPGGPEWKMVRRPRHWSIDLPAEDLPIETGPGLHVPLLRNVMSWLDEPHAGKELGRLRQPFLDAHRRGLLDQFRIEPRAELTAAMDNLIASVPEGDRKEEALWTAGESCLQQFYLSRKKGNPYYGWVRSEQRHIESRYFQRLVEQFPNSPLSAFAQWRLAECKYRQLLDAGRSPSTVPAIDQKAVIDAFLQVDAPQGSHAWAWSRLRVGAILFKSGEFSSAAEHYHEVAERMPSGAEKSLALLHLSVCYEAVGNIEEARRYEKLVLSVPDMFWSTSSRYEDWAPMRMSGTELTDTSHDFIKRMKR